MELTELQKDWIKALRSGKYKQCKTTLFNGEGYCCLGVAVKLMEGNVGWCSRIQLNNVETTTLGLRSNSGGFTGDGFFTIGTNDSECRERNTLAELNDNGWTFDQIADFIEENPERVFVQREES